ncbi:MAG: hypothetical protein HKN22_01155 [Bacteroidia bacterium]|nr:hypothetical protein [Bacteroidia bacterium]
MRSLNKFILTLMIPLAISSCEIKPSDIEYNTDSCSECKMIISDPQFAAQIVTKKGRNYKFDAIECMLRDVNRRGIADLKYILVTTFDVPGKLMNARNASYLISKNIPSPMGGYLSAFSNIDEANKTQVQRTGTIHHWPEILNQFPN